MKMKHFRLTSALILSGFLGGGSMALADTDPKLPCHSSYDEGTDTLLIPCVELKPSEIYGRATLKSVSPKVVGGPFTFEVVGWTPDLKGNIGKPEVYLGAEQSCPWIEVLGPPTAPAAGDACNQPDFLKKLTNAETWSSANTYVLGLINVKGSCAALLGPGFVDAFPKSDTSELVSPDGKWYVGPYTIDGKQQIAVYDTAPIYVNGWTIPTGATDTIPTTAYTNDNKCGWRTGVLACDVPAAPLTSVADALTGITKHLYYGDNYCVGPPSGDSYSVAFEADFYDGTALSVQRAQGKIDWWAVADNCVDFNKAKAHTGRSKNAECEPYTKENKQFGTRLVAPDQWQ